MGSLLQISDRDHFVATYSPHWESHMVNPAGHLASGGLGIMKFSMGTSPCSSLLTLPLCNGLGGLTWHSWVSRATWFSSFVTLKATTITEIIILGHSPVSVFRNNSKRRTSCNTVFSPKGYRKMISGLYLVYPAPNVIVHLFGFDWNSGFAKMWWLEASSHHAVITELVDMRDKIVKMTTEINSHIIILCTVSITTSRVLNLAVLWTIQPAWPSWCPQGLLVRPETNVCVCLKLKLVIYNRDIIYIYIYIHHRVWA